MSDTAEFLIQKVRSRRKELHQSSAVEDTSDVTSAVDNHGFVGDDADNSGVKSPTRNVESERSIGSPTENMEDETQSMLENVELRRNRRKKKMKRRELSSHEASIHEIDESEINEISTNLQQIRDSLVNSSKTSAIENTLDSKSNQDVDDEVEDTVDRVSDAIEEKTKVIDSLKVPTEIAGKRDDESIKDTDDKMAAYRDRLKNRMNRAKTKAESQIVDETAADRANRMKVAVRILKNENDKREEEELQKKMEARRLKKSNKKKASLIVPPEQAITPVKPDDPTEDQAYDFFTKEWDDLEQRTTFSETSVGVASSSVQATEAEELESTEKSKLLRDYFPGGDHAELFRITRATYTPFHQRLAQESESYFVPSITTVPTSKKLSEGVSVARMVEDEGYYVGQRPQVLTKNVNRLENRLIEEADGQSSDRSWFGQDGRVVCLPDPIHGVSYSPFEPNNKLPEGLQTVYRKAYRSDNVPRVEGSFDSRNYQLDIDLSSCQFAHHPLFSREHVLSRRLYDLYKQYCTLFKDDRPSYLQQKLTALRVAAGNIGRNHSVEDGDNDFRLERLAKYRSEMKTTRLEKDRAEATFRKLQKNIIRVWKSLKTLRERQNFVNTSVKLVIHREETNAEEDQEFWDEEILNEVKDVDDEYNMLYRENLDVYQKEMDEWKNWNKKYKEAKKKAQQLQKSPRKNEGEVNDAPTPDEEELLNETKKSKPIPPEPFNYERVAEEVKEKAKKIRRHPGEPRLQFELKSTATITPTNQCPSGEERRRNEIAKRKIIVKILVNNKVVSSTNPRALNSEFNITVGQIFNVQVIQWVREIKLQLYEVASIVSTPSLIAEVFLPVPDVDSTSENIGLSDVEFSSDHVIQYGHEGIGSGVEVQLDNVDDNKVTLLTNGMIKCGISWAVGDDGRILSPPVTDDRNNRSGPFAAGLATGIPELNKLVEWVKKSNLDPNDPANASLLHLIKTVGGNKDGVSKVPDYFRLDHVQEEFNFVADEEIDNNLRFKMIELRESGMVQEFKNYAMIPLKEKEIPRDLFETYERRLRKEQSDEELIRSDPYRTRVSKFLSQVRENVMQRFHQVHHQKSLEDIVVEDQVPDIGTLGFNILSIFQKRRPLKPVRKERKKVTAQNIGGADINVIINVGRAMDIPIRTANRDFQVKGSAVGVFGHQQLLRPFVEVMFQRQTVRTFAADGPNPTWNQELHLPFKAPDDNYSPTNLQAVKDVIYFNVFDEVIIDILEDDRNRDTDVHQRMERRFLGSLRIPFSTVYLNSKVEGTFHLNIPPALLGYERSKHQRFLANIFDPTPSSQNDVVSSYLSIYVIVEPTLPPPEVFHEKFESDETETLLNFADAWQSNLNSSFPNRNIKATVIDVHGKTVFITRYFAEIKPPEELLIGGNDSIKAERVARFVSLIPSISDSVLFPGLCDLWSTSDQFLRMLSGDEEEHAVLLVNYFLSMNKQAWLLLGIAVPEGPTAYVLTKEGDDLWAWNASTAHHFSLLDSYSSLQTIGCLVNQHNIWANIQAYDDPSQTSFDLSKTSYWKPFFSRSFPNPGLSSVQLQELPYFQTDEEYVRRKQDEIWKSLRDNFMKWRRHSRTPWNRHCTDVLSKMLPRYEESTWNRDANFDGISLELGQMLSSYQMSGFPIQQPYTDVESIVEAVYSTGVHLNKSDNVEFALAVYVHPYPCGVLSVWVYVASLVHS
ncbi:CC2D2A (predicted) [Pycnogonum litorale]